MEKIILFSAVIAVTSVMMLSGKELSAQNTGRLNYALTKPASDTVPATKSNTRSRTSVTTNTDDDGKKITTVEAVDNSGRTITASLVNDVLVGLSVGGSTIAKSDFPKYQQLVSSIINKEAKANDKTAVNQNKEIKQTTAQANTNINTNTETDVNTEVNTNVNTNLNVSTNTNVNTNANVNVHTTECNGDNATAKHKACSSDDATKQFEDIFTILMENNIVKQKDGIAFKLTSEELIVNGNKQAPQLHKALKEKYIYSNGDYYTYSSSGGTTNSTIHRVD